MELYKTGKTKNVYRLDDGNFLLKLKDDATGKDGVFDPGENTVGLSIEGLGFESLTLSKYYFEKIEAAGIPTHYIDADLSEVTMTVKPAELFGKGIEVVCRYKAVGSFYRRYADYIALGKDLDGLVEFTLKNDSLQDPPITKDSLEMLGIMTGSECEQCKTLAKQISLLIKDDLLHRGLDLYDIKFEFGKFGDEIILIDEISAGNMRVYEKGTWLQPMELAAKLK